MILDPNKALSVRSYSSFSPSTVSEVFALRLASKLDDSAATRHYAELVEHYPMAHLLTAFHRTTAQTKNGNLSRRFHAFFEPLKHRHSHDANGRHNGKAHKLAGIRTDRRVVGVAIFSDDHLIYARARQLSSALAKAVTSAEEFVERNLLQFDVSSAVFETIPNGHEYHRRTLQNAIASRLAENEVYSSEAAKAELFQAFAYPALTTRTELQEIASRIWPVLDEQSGGPWTHDAAMLGLYVQIEAMFENEHHN